MLEAGAPAAAVADGLDRLGLWWAGVGGDMAAATTAFEGSWTAAQRAGGLAAPLAALHAGVVLADRGDCAAARAPLEEAARLRQAGRWRLSEGDAGRLEAAMGSCALT